MINLITDLITFTQPTNLDRESLSVIESIAKIKTKVNETIRQFNELEISTDEFKKQFSKIIEDMNNLGYTTEYLENIIETNKQEIKRGKVATQNQIDSINNLIEYLKNEKLNIDGKIGIDQIDKNRGKIDQSYLTDELLSQIAGTSSINSTVANKSITSEKIADNSIDFISLNDQTKKVSTINPANIFPNPLFIQDLGGWTRSGNCTFIKNNIDGYNSMKVSKESGTNSLFFQSFTSYEKGIKYLLSSNYYTPSSNVLIKATVFLYLKDTYVDQITKNFNVTETKGKIEMEYTLPSNVTYDEIRVAFSNETDDTDLYIYKPLLIKGSELNKEFNLHDTIKQIYTDYKNSINNEINNVVFNPNNLAGDYGEPNGWYNLGDYCSISEEKIDNFRTLKCYSEGETTIPYKAINFDGGYTGNITSSLKIKIEPTTSEFPIKVKITHIVYTGGATTGGKTYRQSYVIYDNEPQTISITTNVEDCTRLHVCFEFNKSGYNCYVNQLTVVKGDYVQKHCLSSYFFETNVSKTKLFNSSISLNGDSITQGAGYSGGYGKIIAERNSMGYSNIAIGGGTITAETYMLPKDYPELTEKKARHWICRTIKDMPVHEYNIVSGAINDYWNKVPLGEITPDYSTEFDDTTFCGAMESICKQMAIRFQDKKYGFIITYKITNTFYPYGNNTEGKFEVYYNKMIEILEKWSTPYLDLFKSSGFNDNIPEIRQKYTNNNDGVHLNKLGYEKFMVEKVENWMLSL